MDYFSGPVMTEIANAELIKPGIEWYLDPKLLVPSSQKPIGTNFMYTEFKGNRLGGKFTNYQGEPATVEVPGSDKKFATCIGGRESFIIPDELVMALKSGNLPWVASQALAEFNRRMRNFRTRAVVRRYNTVASAFLRGSINIMPYVTGTSGNLNANSQGAYIVLPGTASCIKQVDFSPTSVALNAYLPSSTVTVPDWAQAGTDIEGFMREVKDAFIRYTGRAPKLVHYGKNIPSYMGNKNTTMQTYWSRNQVLGAQFERTNEVPGDVCDFQWVPAHRQYFIDESNTNASPTATAWMDADTIIVTPEIDEDWYEFVEGSCKVPVGFIPTASAQNIEEALASFEYRWGISGYTQFLANSNFTLSAVLQDYMLPVPKNGLQQWIIKVH